MWIRKRNYEKVILARNAGVKTIQNQEKKIEELEEKIEKLNKDIYSLRESKMNLEDLKVTLNHRIEILDRNNDILMKTNHELTEWINKIINEVGLYEIENTRAITIPIYKDSRKLIAGRYDEMMKRMPDFLNTEEIVIPQIRFVRTKNKEV